jgi:transposase-like protein
LTSSQKLDIIEKLKLEIIDETKILSQRQLVVIHKCSNCESENIIKFGQYNGKNRYKCKDCQKTFSDFTGTSVSYIKKKNLWLKSLELMLENKSIREMSKILEVSTKTVFEWRHKILISLENIFTRDFKGIVEMDDIYLNFNQKGRKIGRIIFDRNKRGISNQKTNVMVMSDRYGTLDMKVTTLGRMSVEDLERVIDESRLNDDNIICSDSHRSIKSYISELGLKHKTINVNKGQHVVEGIYHVQKVNSLTREFKDWLKLNFNNVSTKYLQNYLFWFKMEKILRNDVEGLNNFLKYTLKDEETINRKCNIENDYQDFLEQSLSN